MNYSEIESKVREATNDDPWGPSGQLMGEIAKYDTHSLCTMCALVLKCIDYKTTNKQLNAHVFQKKDTYTHCVFVCVQVDLHVRAVPRGDEHAVDQDAQRQQEELETGLQGTGTMARQYNGRPPLL